MSARLVLALALLGGCAKESVPPAEADPAAQASGAPASTGDWSPDAREQELLRALAVRDPEPVCADLDALVDDPVTSLRAVVAHVEMPPWAPMRAAACLLEAHPEAARVDAVAWVADPERQGLARVALGQLDVLPRAVALDVARAALRGPDPDLARRRVGRAADPEVRALVTDE